jgi:hypothetical protein
LRAETALVRELNADQAAEISSLECLLAVSFDENTKLREESQLHQTWMVDESQEAPVRKIMIE